MEKTIEIPEGYEARIEGNKVILEPKESEDERIRKELLEEIEFIIPHDDETDSEGLILPSYHARIDRYKSYLEKQKEQKPKSCDCSRDEESYMNGIHHVLMNPEAYGLIKQKPASISYNHENDSKPAEWSEADKLHLNNAILVAKKEWGVNSYTARWLESLRDNYKKCNSHWKPSEEQMGVDLEKFTEKIKTFQGRYKYPEIVSIKGAMAFMARMFYQYPNIARQWYDSLPKATMD